MKPRPPEFMKFAVDPIKATHETSTPKEEQADSKLHFLCYKALHEYPAGRDLLDELIKRVILNPTFPAMPQVMDWYGGASNYALFLEGQRSIIRQLQDGIKYYKSGGNVKTDSSIIKE